MNIKTQADWWNLAEQTLPRIYDYVKELLPARSDDWRGLEIRIEEANFYLKNKDIKNLHDWFEGLWTALPDRPEIRFGPFFDICDLCSEYWGFQEEDSISE